jgi:hypothetical protein
MRHPSLAEDVRSALAHNLALLQWLARRVREAQTAPRRGQFLREFCRVLEGRFAAMEAVVVPELKARGCRCEASDSVFVHVVLRPELGRMLGPDAEPSGAEEASVRFADRVMDHLQRETLALAPCIGSLLNIEDALLLGRHVRFHLGEPGSVTMDADPLPPPSAQASGAS